MAIKVFKNPQRYPAGLLCLAALIGGLGIRSASANSISLLVPGTDGLNNPLATGLLLPAGVAFTVNATGIVDALSGGAYTSCTGTAYGCSYRTDPSGAIVSSNAASVGLPGNPGDKNLWSGSSSVAIDGLPIGGLVAELIPVNGGSATFTAIGGTGTGGVFAGPALDSQISLFDNDNYNVDNAGAYSLTLSYVPEPASLAMLGIGVGGAATVRRRRSTAPMAAA